MQHLFWLVEGKVAGRSGPNKDSWDLQTFKDAGIGAVLSVNGGEGCEPSTFKQLNLRYECIPLSRNVPPQNGDVAICVAQLPKALAFIQQCEADGVPVVIHCRSGKDRTGLIMAYYLMVNGAAPLHAVSQVRNIRDIAFTAEGWDQFAFDVLYALQD
ncbi:dual specificity protein phosphatase family protein [Shewanella glacialipiscicola]|uniref:phosphatase domain-containing protein n=1 Tax=Shewanella glacialipiscicola TaxID=614069 RepID=UPI0021D865F6|nr:dual specificity protein phosphatase family protein [Shewanella glacialipiscicola]MCU7994607.1 dual specificity protein phosphatase family protein [Shewanella glacialipiscicola]MCU8026078.1 dual specificity protein phosphatase family protein [Shewanella glacialipiscicola]